MGDGMDDGACRLIEGDCLDVMRGMPDASVDAIVADPPAGISFMGKAFDSDRGGRLQWVAWLAERMAEAARVARPGHYALVWALPRTSHWTACAIEDAGWTLVERVAHVFGQGFPKSKARLKPAVEDWWLCRAPGGGKVRELGIDACRIAGVSNDPNARGNKGACGGYEVGMTGKPRGPWDASIGRYPPNLLYSHHPDCEPCGRCVTPECPVAELDRQTADLYRAGNLGGTPRIRKSAGKHCYGDDNRVDMKPPSYGDSGGASRFFPTFAFEADDFTPFLYHAKVRRKDRGEGNTHPTVKPTGLMRWLCRLITPPGGTILDPFMGSGSTGKAALAEGFWFIGIESDPDYFRIASDRLTATRAATPLFARSPAGAR
jgi:DNA modification methylase